jgi:hypothetical protein
MRVVDWFAGRYQVSVVAVVKAADRVAQEAASRRLGSTSVGSTSQWKRDGSKVPTAAQELFGKDSPAPLEYVVKSEELFERRCFARWVCCNAVTAAATPPSLQRR